MTTKTCFVAMPISKSDSCTSEEWTRIYEKIIKPAVENAGLGFKCKRSVALRGNILKDIIMDLHKNDVVIADLTDQNANVFYELGVRHGLKDGTIILTQDRKFASIFDLNNYASHVYDWKTDKGRKEMTSKIQELLKDFVQNPNKPDNPVSDFLRVRPVYRGASKGELDGVIEFDQNNFPHIVLAHRTDLALKEVIGILLLANTEKGITLSELVKQVSSNWKRQTANQVSRTITQMTGWIIKEGQKRKFVYRLSGTGRTEVLKIILKLKSEDKK